MAKRYAVYYTQNLMTGFSTPTAFDEATFTEVGIVEAENLEDVFRKMNVVEGDELPVQLKVRSMCAGDVVRDIETGKLWFCALMGWQEIEA